MEYAPSPAISLRLAQLGLPVPAGFDESEAARLVRPVLARQRELSRRLAERYCAADQRIQGFLDDYLADVCPDGVPQLPHRTFVLDEPGLAATLSLPWDGDEAIMPLLSSYRVANGILHNPANDRRTTAGVFHIAEGGLPIPDDKIAVAKPVFAALLEAAFRPPQADMVLPYMINAPVPAACFVSLLLRPVVHPEVPGFVPTHHMEIRFFAPGSLISNLDFVERIFGNGGDPYLPENDVSLDPATWTSHSGCVILAPHLIHATKKELGLPNVADATKRQRRDRQCWSDPDECYNDGKAFKVCARDKRGVIVTVIADNYYGYCKKEVKTQISYSANLFGNSEEEHAGGARIYPSYNLGQEYKDSSADGAYTIAEVLDREPDRFLPQPEGHALDATNPDIVLVPANTSYSLRTRTVSWDAEDTAEGGTGRRSIPLSPTATYLGPNGYRVHMEPSPADRTQWSLISTISRQTQFHKPATVSGGGKSEISKAISDAFLYESAYTPDFAADMAAVAQVLARDYSDRFADPARHGRDARPILSDRRSLGSVIKLLTPSPDFTPAYNDWLAGLPGHIIELVFTVKRHYRPEWGQDWQSHFGVGMIDGRQGNSLRLDGANITVSMLRVGFEPDGSWRLFELRPDFHPAAKVQTEDDISASTVVPGDQLGLPAGRSYKVLRNCEELLFQRPDDAIHRGYDKQTESDMARSDVFISNFQPLTRDEVRAMRDDAMAFSQFTAPMAGFLSRFADATDGPAYAVSSANPRLVDGKPTKNPRYLQRRPDRVNVRAVAEADLATHLARRVPTSTPLALPVDVVAAGRRNNPPEADAPALCAYAPLHYMELPELFMEFISSMTGKSPSTTGAGSEGALTKGPFNALPAIIDLNTALLSYVLTGYDGWVSSAGYIGPKVRVDHDLSLLIPEVFARMTPAERAASALIAGGMLEKIPDVEVGGRVLPASRLGYRITERFVRRYFGRVFLHPDAVFTPAMLRPELQDPGVYAESVDVIVATHERVAREYFADGTVSLAAPPLRALLEIMAYGATSEGWTLSTPEFRALFDPDTVWASDWYAARLEQKRADAIARGDAEQAMIERWAATPGNKEPSDRLAMADRIAAGRALVERVNSAAYQHQLLGTTGSQVL